MFMFGATALMVVAGCGEKKETTSSTPAQGAPAELAASPSESTDPNTWQGEIVTTMNSGGYTYVQIDTGSETIWAAGPETEVTVGQMVAVDKVMPMTDFHAKSLDRTFDVIYFAGAIRDIGTAPSMPSGHDDQAAAVSRTVVEKVEIQDVAKVAGGYTVEEIYRQSPALSGQTVKLRGQVVKFTPNIMGTNWVHIQDGTGSGDTADLTVTTSANVEVGDLVLVEGPLSVNKDFGAGYKYAAIIEGAAVTKE
jgi:hypothetical protein